MKRNLWRAFLWVYLLWLVGAADAFAYTVNQVTFEFRPTGRYRVKMFYTIPAVKEFREAYVEFPDRKVAEKFYFAVLRGADFYFPDPQATKYHNGPVTAEPW